MAVALMAVFICANFVAMVFLTWLPTFLTRTFHMSLTMAGFSATAYLQVASVLGVLTGGMVADGWVRKDRRGRMWTQAVGLFAGVPFLLLTGWTFSVAVSSSRRWVSASSRGCTTPTSGPRSTTWSRPSAAPPPSA